MLNFYDKSIYVPINYCACSDNFLVFNFYLKLAENQRIYQGNPPFGFIVLPTFGPQIELYGPVVLSPFRSTILSPYHAVMSPCPAKTWGRGAQKIVLPPAGKVRRVLLEKFIGTPNMFSKKDSVLYCEPNHFNNVNYITSWNKKKSCIAETKEKFFRSKTEKHVSRFV